MNIWDRVYGSLRGALLGLAIATTLAACGSGGTGDTPPATVAAPVVTTPPASVSVDVGQPATFTVAATGSGLTYQWQRGTSDIAGATGASYVTPATTPADDGATFRVVVRNAGGAATSAPATLTVVVPPPVITTHPSARSVTAGETATFTVAATGYGLSYQWQRGTTDVAGATADTYVTPATALADDGATFRVVVRNAGGSVTSNPATLTVAAPFTPARVTPSVVGTAGGGVALKADGTVWAWGDGSQGQLGRGGTASTNVPVQVKDAAGTGVLDRVVQISAGPQHVLALRSDGTVWAWGTTYALGATSGGTQTALLPVQVAGVGGAGVLTHAVDVSAGDGVNAAVLDDGTVVAWGDNRRGAVGIGSSSGGAFTPAESWFPAPVAGATGVVEASAGYQRVLARRSDGTVASWGSNPDGELGRSGGDTATPSNVGGISSAVRVVAGKEHSLAILADGSARIWGKHGYTGTAGAGTGATCSTSGSPTPVAIPRPAGTASGFAGASATLATSLFAFAGNLHQTGVLLADLAGGQCSQGLERDATITGVVGVSRTWGNHAHAWDSSGRVVGFGENRGGELGVGDVTLSPGGREIPGFNLLGTPPASVQVFFVDFESPLPPEVSPGTAAPEAVQGFAGLGPAAGPFAGRFMRSETGNTVTVTLSNLPPHRAISLAFLFAAIDSLDGAGSFPSGDYFQITLDGAVIFREAFANATPDQIQTYLAPPGVELARRVDLGFAGPGSFYTDSAYDLGADPLFQHIPHTASTATFTFRIEGAGIQSLDDESWAMDNLRVSVDP